MIKPILLNNWPQSRIDHEEISYKIKNLFNEFYKTRSGYFTVARDREDEQSERDIASADIVLKSNEFKSGDIGKRN